MKKKNNFVILIILLTIVCLSVGYSAYGTKLSISELGSSIRLNKDIRVTGISVVSTDTGGISNYEEYNVDSISMDINLPTEDAIVTYKVNITNFESTEMGIFDITGIPNSLEYSISKDSYVLKDKICDNKNNCSLGISKDIYISISYKDGMFDSTNTQYNINLNFEFRMFHKVEYVGFDGNYPEEVMDGDDLIIDFFNYAPRSVDVYLNSVKYNDFNYLNGVLSVNDVTGNLKIVSYVESPNIFNSGLYPVKYVDDSWVLCSTDDEGWYNYSKQKWANAVILKDNVSKVVGNTIDVSSDVRAMFVWIPKYEYKISSDGSNEIFIKFISKEETTASSGYIIHSAFKFGNENIAGIWFGKFETSTLKTNSCYLNSSRDNCNNNNQEPFIIPNVFPLREQSIYYQYLTSKKMINYLNDSSNADSHMVKNNEWGAVAYLSQSKYGKYGNVNYIGVNKEVYANTSENLYTGMSGGTPNYSNDNELLYFYDDGFVYDTDGKLVQENGIGASTTGNITGVYDMNGGTHEYVMGYLTTASSTWGAAASYNYAEFTSTPDSKYYDAFNSTNINTACSDGICYGHALSETSRWYNDDMTFVTVDNPWIMRGGVFDTGVSSGIFSYTGTLGYSGAYASFRISLVFTN